MVINLEIIYFIFLIVYIFLGFKINKWQTLYRLGLDYLTPEFFIKYNKLYCLFDLIIFLTIVMLPVCFKNINLYFVFLSLLAGYIINVKSRTKAVREYKNFLLEMAHSEKDIKTRKFVWEEVNKSDYEILKSARCKVF